MVAVTIQAIHADRDLVEWIGFTAGGMTDRDLVINRQAGRTIALCVREDIAFMIAVAIHPVNADFDLVIGIGSAAGGMAECDLAIHDARGAGGTAIYRHRVDIVGMPAMLGQRSAVDSDLHIRVRRVASGMADRCRGAHRAAGREQG